MFCSIITANFPVQAASAGTSGDWSDFIPANLNLKNVDGVYEVSNAEELAWIAGQVNGAGNTFSGKTVKLLNDIDLSAHYWMPIGYGDDYSSYYFRGTLDGNGKRIFGLKIGTAEEPDSNLVYCGLFGRLDYGAVIKDLGLEDVKIYAQRAESYGGGLAGYIYGYSNSPVTITNCYSTGVVSAVGNKASAGGLVGKASRTILTNSYSEGRIIGGNVADPTYLGGLAGYANYCEVYNCYSVSTISAGKHPYAGGLAGYSNYSNISTILMREGVLSWRVLRRALRHI